MKKINAHLLEEAQKMKRAWEIANPDSEIEWNEREIAATLGVSYGRLKKLL